MSNKKALAQNKNILYIEKQQNCNVCLGRKVVAAQQCISPRIYQTLNAQCVMCMAAIL